MRWLAVCLLVCTAVAAIEQRCEHPSCSGSGWDFKSFGKAQFTVEGHILEFGYGGIKVDEIAKRLNIDCGGFQTLDSPALPRFAAPFRVPFVFMINCPLPTNGSLGDIFTALNVVLTPVEGYATLLLTLFPAAPLAAHHFVGLDELTDLKIESYGNDIAHQRPLPEAGFLSGLPKLRSLHMIGVRLPAGETRRLPQSLRDLWLCGESLNSLPGTLPEIISETIHFLPKLKLLMLDQYQFSAPEFTDSAANNVTQSNATYELQSIYLLGWKDHRIGPFEQCNVLRKINIERAKVKELPDRFIAACPLVEELTIEIAEELTSLPPKFLEGATALKRLTITLTHINTLPDKFLESSPNLVEVDLSSNRLRRELASDVFVGPRALQVLNIERNKLYSKTIAAIAPLTSITKLIIGENSFRDFCEENGYSVLRNFTNLTELSLEATLVTRICRDWREDLVFLKTLNLIGTQINTLQSTDFLFTRDESVKNAEVKLSTSVHTVNFTKADYDLALTTPGPGVTFKVKNIWLYANREVTCDCSASWLRRAVAANGVIKIEGLPCSNGRGFKDMTPEEMCPESGPNSA